MKPPPAHGLVNRFIALALLLLIFAGSLGLGAVWARQGISSAANRNRSLDLKLADVERRLDDVTAEVAAAVNPDMLLKQNQAMRLGLEIPRENQVVRVDESPELRLAQKGNRELFTLASASAVTSADGSSSAFRVLTASLR
jgi:hypothetical protein